MQDSIKTGVVLSEAQVWAFAFPIIREVYHEFGYPVIITSGLDSHENGLHPEGLALDLRTRHLLSVRPLTVVEKLSERLGSEFDVILESDHIHVEYDPK